jgi:predicted outer membrane protein
VARRVRSFRRVPTAPRVSAAALAALALLGATAAPGPGAMAQGERPGVATREARPVVPAEFLGFALSSAAMQARAAGLAATRDTRPEVKGLAQEMVRFREAQTERLRAFAQARGIAVPEGAAEFGHRVVLQNLEPLDYLALSRRYAEVQVQALEQEIRGYEAAAAAPDDALKGLAEAMLPQLRQWLDGARKVLDAVKP